MKKVLTSLLLFLAFGGVALAQPGPPPGLTIGSTPITGGSSGNCLTQVSGRLQSVACATGAIVTPASGGTGTGTVFSAGSVVFAGTSGIYQQDNANFFYSSTNKRLGIGTGAPAIQLHVVGQGNSADGVLVDSTTQARVMVNNTSGGSALTGSVVFSKNGTAQWTVQNDPAGSGGETFAITDNVASRTPLQINSSGNVVLSNSALAAGTVTANSGTAIPAGGTTGNGFAFSNTANFGITYGSGAPTQSAAQGSLYLRSDGVPFYNVNGSTTWASLAAGSGTVNGGTVNQLAWYAGSGSTISGLATANNALLVTSSGGVPSIATVIPNNVTATTQAAATNNGTVSTTQYADRAVSNLVLRNYIGGCNTSNDVTTPNTTLDISACQAADSTNAVMIVAGTFTKTTAGAWTSGSGNAGMGNGLTVAASTQYDVCLGYNAGVPDYWFDTSNRSTSYSACANKPSGITGVQFRRIGWILTDASAHIIAFIQNGNLFQWVTEVRDVNASTGGNKALGSVPSGIQVQWQGRIDGNSGSANPWGISVLPTTMTWVGSAVISNNTFGASAPLSVITNTSQQVQVTLIGSVGTYELWTVGWIDFRGTDK